MNQLEANRLAKVTKIDVENRLFRQNLRIPVDVVMQYPTAVSREIAASISFFLLSRKVRTETVGYIEHYDTWWDHFKGTWFPVWLLERFPAKTRSEAITINHYHICPHLEAESHRKHVEFLSYVTEPYEDK